MSVREERASPSAREADHRIANHLSMVAAFVRMARQSVGRAEILSRDDAVALFDECGRRIETIARVHRLLADQGEGADVLVAGFISEIAEGIVRGLSRNRDVLEVHVDDHCRAPANQAALLGLIVGELITNAVKYAHPSGVAGAIRLTCKCGGAMVLTVADDGVGLPVDFDPETSRSVGFRLMRSLAEELGAILDFDSSCLGLSARLYIPQRTTAA